MYEIKENRRELFDGTEITTYTREDLQDFIKSQPTTITEFDETLVKRLIMKITVFEDHFTIDFKSGITIDIEA